MTNLEAAIRVLEAEGGPLHFREIAMRAIAKGYVEPKGKTPEATMASTLYGYVKQMADKEEPAKVEARGKGRFALATRKIAGTVEQDIHRNNDRVRRELHEYLFDLDPRKFELLIGQLLGTIGFDDVTVSKYSGDGGIDVDATLTVGGVTRVRTAVQVKRWKKNVPAPVVRELRGGLLTDQRGLIITTADFTRDAKVEAAADGKTPISLIGGERLVQLLADHQIGVIKRSVQLLELNLEELVGGDVGGGGVTTEKAAALWPLPGGQEKYFNTLLHFLDQIGRNSPTVDEMTDWVIENYEKVTKATLVKSYLRTPLYAMGVVDFDGEQVKLTDEGDKLRKSRSEVDLLVLLKSRILGVEELLAKLAEHPMTLADALTFMRESLKLAWETDAQVKYRVLWLAACGAVERKGKKWVATVAARK